MSEKTHGGRTLYLNPKKSKIEAELDALFRSTDRVQPLMRSFILAGYELSKKGIFWDSINNRLSHGNDAVTWVIDNSDPEKSVLNTPVPMESNYQPELIPEEVEPTSQPEKYENIIRKKFSAFTKGA